MKTFNILFISVCLFGSSFFVACKKKVDVSCYEKDLGTISSGFETTLEDWVALGGSGERAKEEDIQISTDTFATGQKCVKFTVSPESTINSGVRSELTFDPLIEEGDDVYWEYSLFIPIVYQDVYLNDANGKVNWQLMGQWHDQPDECIGETWENFPGLSPPVGVYYSFLDENDPDFSSLRSEAITNDLFGFDSTWNQVSVLTLVYNNESVGIAKINKGEWYHLKFHIHWSTNDDGVIEGWLNGEKFSDGKVSGKNMWNKASHYLKFGLYRNPTIPHTNSVYYDDVKVY